MTRSHFGSVQLMRPGLYRIWWTKNGVRRSEYVRGNREAAEHALALREVSRDPSSATWGSFYEASVAPTYANLATKTVEDYERTWNVELAPRIACERVSDMDWKRANDVLTDISAPTVQRRAGALLKKMCNIAVRQGVLESNPVRAIQYAPHRPRAKRLVDCTEVASLLRAVEGIKYEPVVLLSLGCGMRPEESYAACWEDVSGYEAFGGSFAKVKVDKALVTVRGGSELKSTKNTPSEREAICGEPFASRLLVLADGRSGPIVASGGGYTSPATIAHNWKAWCARNGVPHVTFENMRSSYATMMGEALAPDSVVAGNMGHVGSSVKSRHYQRVTMRSKCMAASMLADLLKSM